MSRRAPEPGGRLPRVAHGALRKRWRWVGAFSPEVMLCVALADVGGLRRGWWAVLDRRSGLLREEDLAWRPAARIALTHAIVQVRARDGSTIDLALEEGPGVAVRCPHGDRGGWTWTRKHAGLAVAGRVVLAGTAVVELGQDARAVVDDTLGYHAHRTHWRWAAGVGRTTDGRDAAWNLVSGVNDPVTGSERAIWLDGEPHEPGRVAFAEDLGRVTGPGGLDLTARPRAERAHRQGLGPLSSRYRQPFAEVSGTLGHGIVLAEGCGVLEDHVARW